MDVVLARRAGCKKSQIKAKLFFCFTTLPITSMGKRAMNNERQLLQVSLSPPAHSLSLSLSLSFFASPCLFLSLFLSLLLLVPLQLKVWSLYIVKRRVGQAGVIEIALNDFQQRHLYVRTKTVKQDQLKLSDLLLLLLLLLLLHSLCHDSAATHKNIRFIRTQILDAFKKRLLPRTKDFKCLDNLSPAVDVIKLFLGEF